MCTNIQTMTKWSRSTTRNVKVQFPIEYLSEKWEVNPFVPNALFLYPLKTSENRKGVEERVALRTNGLCRRITLSISHCVLNQRRENTECYLLQGRNPGESELCHEQEFTILESFGECIITRYSMWKFWHWTKYLLEEGTLRCLKIKFVFNTSRSAKINLTCFKLILE